MLLHFIYTIWFLKIRIACRIARNRSQQNGSEYAEVEDNLKTDKVVHFDPQNGSVSIQTSLPQPSAPSREEPTPFRKAKITSFYHMLPETSNVGRITA